MDAEEFRIIEGVLLEGEGPPRATGRRELPPSRESLAVKAFDHHPYGLLLVDDGGRALAHNDAASAIFGDAVDPDEDDGQHLVDEVLTRVDEQLGADEPVLLRALSQRAPLPEIRIDLPVAAAVEAVWVTVAALGADGDVLLELRPGVTGDRRRRTRPYWARGPHLRVRTLGRTHLESAETPVAGRWLEHRTGRLFKYLVAERHRAVHPDEIVEHLWPDSGARGLQSVRYFVYRLREQLEPDRTPRSESSFIRYTEGAYSLDQDRIQVDADEYEAAVKAGLAALGRRDREQARVALEHAVELYTGDFLAEEPYAEWAMSERTRLRALAADALEALAGMAQDAGELDRAAAHLVRLADLDPFDVEIHRRLITMCLWRGRRTEALRRYTALRERLMSTFGEELDFTLGELARGSGPRRAGPRPSG